MKVLKFYNDKSLNFLSSEIVENVVIKDKDNECYLARPNNETIGEFKTRTLFGYGAESINQIVTVRENNPAPLNVLNKPRYTDPVSVKELEFITNQSIDKQQATQSAKNVKQQSLAEKGLVITLIIEAAVVGILALAKALPMINENLKSL